MPAAADPAAPTAAAPATNASRDPVAALAVYLARLVPALGLRLIRQVMDTALAALEVTAACRHEIAVALTEACSNVVAHAQHTDDYEVTVTIADHGA